MKKKPKKKVLPTLIILIILVVGSIFVIKKLFKPEKQTEVKVLSVIEKYNYTLDDNETDIYKKYFKDLENVLQEEEINQEEYCKLISKLFVIDFYTLNNKVTNKDIGGVQFLKEDIRENFSLKASNTLYKYIKNNIYGKRKQNLPEVKDVEVEEIKEKELDDTKEKAYEVRLSIEYVKDMGYTEIVLLTLSPLNDRINIVAIKEVV